MEKKTRTEYSARNTGVAIIARILAIFMGFFTRIVFTRTLSAEYVGVNGLFTDILNVLALSELGVGAAITYALYKPIACGDIEKQKSLMRLYRIFYRFVALIVAATGLLLVPFLPFLMKDNPDIPGLTAIYLMYLLNSVLSYFMIYKKTLIEATQQSYIDVLIHTGFLVLQNVVQIILLLTTKNFILFLTTLILCTLFYNISVSVKAEHMFPFLKDKDAKALPPDERKDVFNNVRAMMMHKIGNVLVNNTDNILLARLVSSVAVGCYSNYYLVIGSVRQILNQTFLGITASVGNLGVSEDKEHIKKVFKASVLAGLWMYGFAAICLYLVIDPFIGFCFGQSYMFSESITLILCVNFYLFGVRQASMVFRDSMGVFKYDRWVSLIEALVNLVVSVVLGLHFGIWGVFCGTMVATLLTSFWVEPYVLYKYKLEANVWPYFGEVTAFTLLTGLLGYGEKVLFSCVPGFSFGESTGSTVLAFVLRVLACAIITNAVYLLIAFRTKAFRTLMSKLYFLMGVRRERNEKTAEAAVQADYSEFNDEEKWLLSALKEGLTGERDEQRTGTAPDPLSMHRLISAHSVLGLCEKQFMTLVDGMEDETGRIVKREVLSEITARGQRAFQIIFLVKKVSDAFEKAGIAMAVMKGPATARYYDSPEKRKSGDVDILLLEPEKLAEAKQLILSLGCSVASEQPALHHIVFNYEKTDIPIELHTMLAEPFDNANVNKYVDGLIAECRCHVEYVNSFRVRIPALTGAFHAYELLLHMLQHFLRAGFGLKLLCDWVVFWNKEDFSSEEKEIYLRLVTESGIKGFSDMVTVTCVKYLGLRREKVSFMNIEASERKMNAAGFLKDIFEGEEFGHADGTRMVALRGTGIGDYVREFHHQMRLNHPKASKCVLLWPVLWCVTYVVFIRNNKRLRDMDTKEIYKKAAERGKLVKQMAIFK